MPRPVIGDPPSEVMVAPKVAVVWAMDETVGVEIMGAVAALVTVTSVQPPQLFVSSDSAIVPTMAVLLSAQNLTEYVPAEAKVYEALAVFVPPLARIGIGEGVAAVRGLTVPPVPWVPKATCIEFKKVAPVDPPPVLEIVEVKACGILVVAEAGEGAEAVRFGREPVVKLASAEYPLPVMLLAYPR